MILVVDWAAAGVVMVIWILYILSAAGAAGCLSERVDSPGKFPARVRWCKGVQWRAACDCLQSGTH